jgi:hypothetical protein
VEAVEAGVEAVEAEAVAAGLGPVVALTPLPATTTVVAADVPPAAMDVMVEVVGNVEAGPGDAVVASLEREAPAQLANTTLTPRATPTRTGTT